MKRTRYPPYNTMLSLLIAVLLLAGLIALFGMWLFGDLPAISSIDERRVRPTTQIVDRHGRPLYEVIDPASGRQIDLSLHRVPESCRHATLATEDSRFYWHAGFDPAAIARATWQNLRAGGDIVSGGSTLTQQLVRIMLLDKSERYEQTIRRKLREAWLAWRLERIYSKDEILALYLNQSYYGNFAFGLEAAAQTFFAKPAEELSRGECALLAGLVQYPAGYNPLAHPEIAKNRQLTVLRLMRESGFLTEGEVALIAAEPLRYRSNLFEIEAPHFVMYVQDLLVREVGVERLRRGGLRVVTSIDLDLQRSAETAVSRQLDLLNCRTPGVCTPSTNPTRRVDNAAAVVLDASSGEILAMVGSPDYFDESIHGNVNGTLTTRQPGSAIKPLTYAVAMDPGWSARIGVEPLTPADILADLPTTFRIRDDSGGNVPYQPVNYDRQFHGPVSVRTALANSYNIPAVKVLDRIGVESLRSAALQSGIRSLTGEYGLALTLGGGEVSLLELSAAYGAFLDGTRLDPVAVLDIQERDVEGGSTSILHRSPAASGVPVQVIGPETAFLITDILSDNQARIPAFGEGSVLELPFPVAVKTGTTTDWRDNWTVGYTPDRIVGVWVGNADNAPMLDVSGIDGAGPIWREIMIRAHRTDPQPFTVPENIVSLEICSPSGLLPSEACPETRRERFINGTQPARTDDQFVRLQIDTRTMQPAAESTPEEHLGQRTFWRLPAAYRDWMEAHDIATLPVDRGLERISESVPDNLGAPDAGPLVLEAPISNTGFQIHPALPLAHQRIPVAAFSQDGTAWASIRLLVDGDVIAEVTESDAIRTWWTLEPGRHEFWVEGTSDDSGEQYRSPISTVVVTMFDREQTRLALGETRTE